MKICMGWMNIWGGSIEFQTQNESSQLTIEYLFKLHHKMKSHRKGKYCHKHFDHKSELLDLFFGFSPWTGQQTLTPYRPLAVPLNSGLLFSHRFSFSPTDSFFITPQVSLSPKFNTCCSGTRPSRACQRGGHTRAGK